MTTLTCTRENYLEIKSLQEWIDCLEPNIRVYFADNELGISDICIQHDTEWDDTEGDSGMFSWDATKKGWGMICQTKGKWCVYQKTLSGCRKAMARQLGYVDLSVKLARIDEPQ